jgi:hypothetical protein
MVSLHPSREGAIVIDNDRPTVPSLIEERRPALVSGRLIESRRTAMLTEFEKTLIGVAEAIISARNCPHGTEYPTSTPCSRCVEREMAMRESLSDVVTNESNRRFLITLRHLGRYPHPKEQT